MSFSQTPIQTAQQIIQQQQVAQQQTVQPQVVATAQVQQPQQMDQLSSKVIDIINNILQVAGEIAYDIVVLEDEKCKQCSIVQKCRKIIKLLKDLIELQRQFRS